MSSENDTHYELMVLDTEMQKKITAFKKDWYRGYKNISKEKTPQVDGTGKKIIDKRPWDGLEYIVDAYMDECLDKHFPGWSWKKAGGLNFLGSEWVAADGELWIVDEKLLAFGIQPPYRVYWGGGAARVAYKKDKPHTPENVVDIDKVVKSAITEAKKYAINRLTGIGDDIYGKRMEMDGAGSYEDVVMEQNDATSFGRWVADNKLKWSTVFEVLEVKGISEIQDFGEAIKKIKEAKGWK